MLVRVYVADVLNVPLRLIGSLSGREVGVGGRGGSPQVICEEDEATPTAESLMELERGRLAGMVDGPVVTGDPARSLRRRSQAAVYKNVQREYALPFNP